MTTQGSTVDYRASGRLVDIATSERTLENVDRSSVINETIGGSVEDNNNENGQVELDRNEFDGGTSFGEGKE